ncbi:MAG: hypothetical protein CFH40_02414 [Alphaproteobacteria bacterium MarineAlpha10_Bin3]|nr:MAG: hypothetical protein CFH40_02414 [Alphaproteobacteria bacterium MarineAlpha10_Bin3]PPR67106.1 MAG: hypothetical protein CFH09_02414 [Alphaproteobacteria bacterium MarineAlpha4_Bin1]
MTDMATRFQAAIALVESERFAEADAICAQLQAAAPGDAPVLFLRGLIAFHLADSARAVALIGKAIALDPDNPSFHATLGTILIESGARADAISALERALALEPDNLASSRHLARQLALVGRNMDAAASWRRVAAMAQSDIADLLAWGDALEAAHDLDAALTVYRRAAARQPDCVAVQNHLGACQQKLGYLGDAILAFGTSIGLQAHDNPAALGLFAAKQMACDWDDFAQWRARRYIDVNLDCGRTRQRRGSIQPCCALRRSGAELCRGAAMECRFIGAGRGLECRFRPSSPPRLRAASRRLSVERFSRPCHGASDGRAVRGA